MYVIKDAETGNFLSDFSFQCIDENENLWLYTTYTGILGTKFYATKENARVTFDILQKYNIESGANRKLCITEVILEESPIGERKYKYFKKKTYKPVDLVV